MLALWLFGSSAQAQDTGATANGNWEDASIWTAGTVPGTANNVYIGSTYPAGAASTATVTLTQNESAGNLYLGNGNGTSGTLDLSGNTLGVANNMVISQNGGVGAINEGAGGSFFASSLTLQGANSLLFGASDQVINLTVQANATATTAATSNVVNEVTVGPAGVLNLGANLNVVNVQVVNGTLDAQGYNVNAIDMSVNSVGAVTNVNRVSLLSLSVDTLSSMSIQGGMVVESLSVTGDSVLTVEQTDAAGLTFYGESASSLKIDPISSMDLDFDATGWDFRWADPSNGNWINTLESMIVDGEIVLSGAQSYSVYDLDGYTYIGTPLSVPSIPEPASLTLACAACVCGGLFAGWRGRKRQIDRPQ